MPAFSEFTMTYDAIERALSLRMPELVTDFAVVPAAVSLILCPDDLGLRVLFIERAAHEADPWSGNVGFPGGKMEEGDTALRGTAERETLEEVGIDLRRERYLGRLSDVGGTRLHVRVSCFVYGLTEKRHLRLSNEVKEAFWVPLNDLRDPARHGEAAVHFGDREFTRPAFRLPQGDKPPLWGLTYRLVLQFLEWVDSDQPPAVRSL